MWENIIKTKSWCELSVLCSSRYERGKENKWINYNHDYSAKQEYLPHVDIVKRWLEADIIFMHGWEFDIVWGGLSKFPGVSSIAFWLSINYPKQAIKVWDFLRKITNSKTPYELKQDVVMNEKEWNYHVAGMHLRAAGFAIEHNLRLVMGHTHCPTLNLWGVVSDSGDMIDSFTYITIDKRGQISLKYMYED